MKAGKSGGKEERMEAMSGWQISKEGKKRKRKEERKERKKDVL